TPDASAVVFTAFGGALNSSRVAIHSMKSGESHIVTDGTYPVVPRDGQLLFARGDSLWSVPFDSRNGSMTGSPAPVLEGVQVNSGGLANFAVAGNGSLAFVPGTAGSRTVVWATRDG